MKVLMVPSDQAGCGQYRIIQPGKKLGDWPDNQVAIHISPLPTEEEIISSDLLVLQRYRLKYDDDGKGGAVDQNRELAEIAIQHKIPIVYDNDDYDLALPKEHGLYSTLQRAKAVEKVDWLLNNATIITTTTEYIADRFRERTDKPVYVIPNCINFNEPMWNYPKTTSRRIRIGWAGGSSHMADLMLLAGVADEIYRLYGDKVEFLLGGYDTRGTYSWYDAEGKIQTRKSEDHETIWRRMKEVFFGNTPKSAHRVLRTHPFETYGWLYSQFDIGLVPLEATPFTMCKSPLKLIEMGAYKVPVVCSDVITYSATLNSADRAGVLVSTQTPGKTQKAWVSAIRGLIEDPVERLVVGNNLHQLVRDRFDLLKEVKNINRLYRSLVESK